jgi:hypothetical protein
MKPPITKTFQCPHCEHAPFGSYSGRRNHIHSRHPAKKLKEGSDGMAEQSTAQTLSLEARLKNADDKIRQLLQYSNHLHNLLTGEAWFS